MVRAALVTCEPWDRGPNGSDLAGVLSELGSLAAVCAVPDGTEETNGHDAASSISFDDILNDPATTAVLIAAPTALGTRLCRSALAAGKDVLILAPMALTAEDANSLARMAAEQQRILMVENGRPVTVGAGTPLRRTLEHFLHCCRNRTSPLTDGKEGERMPAVLPDDRSAGAAATAVAPAERFPNVSIHPTAEVDDDVVIGDRTRIWHFSHILRGTRIGADCSFGQNCCIGANVTIGNGCRIQNNVSIYDGATLEDDVFCGPSCVFTNVMTPRAFISRKHEFLPTLVRQGASIGANATVVCGTTLGRYCLIGAGAVVIRDVPDHALMVGNPARRIGWVSETGDRLRSDLVCPRTGQRYEETSDGHLRKISGSNG